jgi:hypothetical protein
MRSSNSDQSLASIPSSRSRSVRAPSAADVTEAATPSNCAATSMKAQVGMMASVEQWMPTWCPL